MGNGFNAPCMAALVMRLLMALMAVVDKGYGKWVLAVHGATDGKWVYCHCTGHV